MTNFYLGSGSEVEFMAGVSTTTGYTIYIGQEVYFGDKSHLDTSMMSLVNINTTNASSVLNVGDITYGKVIVFYNGNINVKGSIRLAETNQTSAASSYLFFKETSSIHLFENATISAAYI